MKPLNIVGVEVCMLVAVARQSQEQEKIHQRLKIPTSHGWLNSKHLTESTRGDDGPRMMGHRHWVREKSQANPYSLEEGDDDEQHVKEVISCDLLGTASK